MYLLTSPLMFTARVEEGKGRLGESEVYPAPVSSLKGLCTLGLSVQRADGRHQHGDARGNRVTSYTSAVQAVLGHPVPTPAQYRLYWDTLYQRKRIEINLFINLVCLLYNLVMGKTV